MSKTLEEVMASLSPARQGAIVRRTQQLLEDEMTLRQLRKARGRTQKKVAAALKISQDGVSRLEKRSDLLLSTLRSYVEAMGGNLTLVAQFPGSKPVAVTGFGEMPEQTPRRLQGAARRRS